MSVSIAITLDTRRLKKKTGKYPVKLLVTYNSTPERYQTVYDLSQEEFDNLSASRVAEKLKKIRDDLRLIQRKAADAAASLEPFTFEEFEKDFIADNPLFRQRKSVRPNLVPVSYKFDVSVYQYRFPILKLPLPERGTILETFLFYVNKLLEENRVRTAVGYQTAYFALSRFRGNVKFTDIGVAFLKQFEAWMLQQEYSKTTVGINTRSLRTIFNEAIFQGIIKKEKHYPFGRRLYQCPASRNIKKALTLEDVAKIYYYEPACEQERKAKDFWLFSYFANGINPTDIAYLKYKNIEDGYLIFEPAKTENSIRLTSKPITVFISEDIQRIIDYWGNKNKSPNN